MFKVSASLKHACLQLLTTLFWTALATVFWGRSFQIVLSLVQSSSILDGLLSSSLCLRDCKTVMLTTYVTNLIPKLVEDATSLMPDRFIFQLSSFKQDWRWSGMTFLRNLWQGLSRTFVSDWKQDKNWTEHASLGLSACSCGSPHNFFPIRTPYLFIRPYTYAQYTTEKDGKNHTALPYWIPSDALQYV